MTEYNIEIEIHADDGLILAYASSGKIYEYSTDSVEGADLLSKVFGTDVHTTVYSQDEQMSLEEYERRYGQL